jgi:hypothetical protein
VPLTLSLSFGTTFVAPNTSPRCEALETNGSQQFYRFLVPRDQRHLRRERIAETAALRGCCFDSEGHLWHISIFANKLTGVLL